MINFKMNKIEEIFYSQEEMADSLLRNWCWQCNYKNRKLLVCQDYEDICNLGNKIPNLFQKTYKFFKIKFAMPYKRRTKTAYE